MMAMSHTTGSSRQNDWYTPEEAAALLGVTVTTVKGWAGSDKGGYETADGRVLAIRSYPAAVRGRARFVFDRSDIDTVHAERQKNAR